jgi:hypothetical protein
MKSSSTALQRDSSLLHRFWTWPAPWAFWCVLVHKLQRNLKRLEDSGQSHTLAVDKPEFSELFFGKTEIFLTFRKGLTSAEQHTS